MESIEVLVVKDEDGVLRPLAGTWENNVAGKMRADMYLEKNEDCTIAKATLTEHD